jgi:predicted acylesterase/phospholipase RssA
MELLYGILIGLIIGASIGAMLTGWIAAGRIEDIKRGYDHDDPYRY